MAARVGRYGSVTAEKAGGATYTPTALADFVADQIMRAAKGPGSRDPLRVLDPAIGDGALLSSLLRRLPSSRRVEVYGFDTNPNAVQNAAHRLRTEHANAWVALEVGDFLAFVLDMCDPGMCGSLFEGSLSHSYDLIIANPPYVRTQVMGAADAGKLAKRFNLKGRVDLYYAFLLAMSKVLAADGIAGIIVSNRFMTTKAGASVRRAILNSFRLLHVWDLGDTKLFDVAVLPAVLLVAGRDAERRSRVPFTSIYETDARAEYNAPSPIDALDKNGVVSVREGRRFRVRQGILGSSQGGADVWHVATDESDAWLATVEASTWATFRDVGSIRVGVKTCADKVFTRADWGAKAERPELLRPLITHHAARRFRADRSKGARHILYPHEYRDGRRKAVNLDRYPRSKAYLEKHRQALEAREYLLDAGRQWYEIWVPQDPRAWDRPKLVFRDIAQRPCFWIDKDGCVVNGDCYWMISDSEGDVDLLWLCAAVGNSTFIEAFYDHRFNNKLYAGRRRFITQYVERFPLPEPHTPVARDIVQIAKTIYDSPSHPDVPVAEDKLDELIWRAFGLRREEVRG